MENFNMDKNASKIYANARDMAIKGNSPDIKLAHICAALYDESDVDAQGVIRGGLLYRALADLPLGRGARAGTLHTMAIRDVDAIEPTKKPVAKMENSPELDDMNQNIVRNFINRLPMMPNGPRNLRLSHIILGLLTAHHGNAMKDFICEVQQTNANIINELMNYIMRVEANENGEESQYYSFAMKLNKTSNRNPKQEEDKEEEIPYTTDMLKEIKNNDKPFIGRENEVAALITSLERMDKPNAILVGEPGVGKTDIMRGLAKKMVEGNVPEQIKGKKLLRLDIPGMLAGAQFRGQFEERLKGTLDALCELDRPIVFIDEIHTVLGAGAASDTKMDAADIMKPYLVTGKMRVVGATTHEEFRKCVESDNAFRRRFDPIEVGEPSAKDTIAILKGTKQTYEKFHGVKVPVNAIETAVNMSVKHMHDRHLPDKAFDILDVTCSRVKLRGDKKVTVDDVHETVSQMCHIPKQTMTKSEMDKVRNLDTKLAAQVFGQDEAIAQVTEAIQMSKVGLNDETKPIGSFLFVGPSGVGKTEIAKQLAATLGIEFIRFDMSEYAEPHTVAKLIGSPAGYVGYEDGGILVEKIRNNPHAVVLFDEIEKAHPDVFKIFLQMLDYGMLTDNKGRKADFRNTVIIMTSNAGNSMKTATVGLIKSETNAADNSLHAIKKLMPPELIGRMSGIIHFNGLNADVANQIIKKELKLLTARMKAQGYTVEYSTEAIAEIAKRGISAEYGAREIQNVINKNIKTLFTKNIMKGKLPEQFSVGYDGNEFTIVKSVVIDINEDKELVAAN